MTASRHNSLVSRSGFNISGVTFFIIQFTSRWNLYRDQISYQAQGTRLRFRSDGTAYTTPAAIHAISQPNIVDDLWDHMIFEGGEPYGADSDLKLAPALRLGNLVLVKYPWKIEVFDATRIIRLNSVWYHHQEIRS